MIYRIRKKKILIDLTRKQLHKDISAEVRRELKAQPPLDPITGQPMGSRRNSMATMELDGPPVPNLTLKSPSASSSVINPKSKSKGKKSGS